MYTRRSFTKLMALAGLAGAYAPFANAQAGTARLMIGFPPGTTFDSFARRIAERLRGSVAPTVIVENKSGAGGQIAITTIKDLPADGSQILISPSSLFTIYPHIYKKLAYKNEDLKPIAASVLLEPALAIGPAVPESVKTLKDFIAWTKDNPKAANYASPGAGSMLHLIGAYISKVSNQNWQHVAYRGAAPAIQDMMGGQVTAAVLPIGEFIQHAKTGKLRVLAVSSNSPSTFMPEVPTLKQMGINLSAREWYGFYLPSGATPEVARRTASAVQAALTHPEVVSWASSMGMQMQYKDPEATAALIKADYEEWRELVKVVGFTAES